MISVTRVKGSLRRGLFPTAFCGFIVILCRDGLLDVDWHGAFRGICFSCFKVITPAANQAGAAGADGDRTNGTNGTNGTNTPGFRGSVWLWATSKPQVRIGPIVPFAVYRSHTSHASHTSNTLHLATRSSFYYFHPPITYDSKASGAFPSVTSFLFDSSNILFSAT